MYLYDIDAVIDGIVGEKCEKAGRRIVGWLSLIFVFFFLASFIPLYVLNFDTFPTSEIYYVKPFSYPPEFEVMIVNGFLYSLLLSVFITGFIGICVVILVYCKKKNDWKHCKITW